MDKNKVGTVVHSKNVDGDNLQEDRLVTKIPLDAIGEEGLKLLAYWYVEDFDHAYIDWDKDEIVLGYKTVHFLPLGYATEEVVD